MTHKRWPIMALVALLIHFETLWLHRQTYKHENEQSQKDHHFRHNTVTSDNKWDCTIIHCKNVGVLYSPIILGSSTSRMRTRASRRFRFSLRTSTVWNSSWMESCWSSSARWKKKIHFGSPYWNGMSRNYLVTICIQVPDEAAIINKWRESSPTRSK